MSEPIHIISLGAGVQSSVAALKAARGEFAPMPKAAIFADTQGEPESVYVWLEWLERQLPFPVHRVTVGNLAEHELRIRRSKLSGKLYLKNSIPAFVKKPDGKRGLLGRKCTSDYKIVPIQREVKKIVGLKRSVNEVRCKMWIGISIDEAHRMKPSRVPYIENIWPLIDAGLSRDDCLKWMKDNGYPEPPRSACVFCPFHSDYEWQRMKTNEPEAFARAVEFEQMLQLAASNQEVLKGVPFLHESCKPISEIDFERKIKPANGKINPAQLSLFGNECEGLCGV